MKLSFPAARVSAALILASLVGLQSGCLIVAAGAAGAGTVAYIRGGLEASLEGRYDSVVAAANEAVADLQFARISENKDALTALIVARTADDKKIEITVTKVSANLSRVEIRVGVFGDEFVSVSILDRIKANL
jgi:hypothetical protein